MDNKSEELAVHQRRVVLSILFDKVAPIKHRMIRIYSDHRCDSNVRFVLVEQITRWVDSTAPGSILKVDSTAVSLPVLQEMHKFRAEFEPVPAVRQPRLEPRCGSVRVLTHLERHLHCHHGGSHREDPKSQNDDADWRR